MVRQLPSILPEPLVAALDRFGSLLERGKIVAPELEPTLDLINRLPAAAISRTASAIPTIARLHLWRRPDRGFTRLFARRLTDKEQLLSLPGLEYLFVFHFDGRIREAALRKITGGLPSPFLFAAIAWRLNDWVEPVRQAALLCARRSFPQTAPDIIARAAMALLVRQQSWGRWEDEQAPLDEAFARADVGECLADILIASRTGPAARTLRAALRGPVLDNRLQHIARAAIQPSVRAVALRTLIEGSTRWPVGTEWEWLDKSMGFRRRRTTFDERPLTIAAARLETTSLGIADRSPAVRRIAIDGIMRQLLDTPEGHALALRLATDRSPSIRERAGFILARKQPEN